MHVLLFRVQDVEREIAFYKALWDLEELPQPRVIGQIGHLRLPGISFPEASPYGGTFEIIAGGSPQTPPADRIHSPTTPVLQVDDVPATLAKAVALGATKVNDPWLSERREADDDRTTGVILAYFADPEGHVIGLRSPLRP